MATAPLPGPAGAHDPRFPPPRCGARLRYMVMSATNQHQREARYARCHLDEGHDGHHRATISRHNMREFKG